MSYNFARSQNTSTRRRSFVVAFLVAATLMLAAAAAAQTARGNTSFAFNSPEISGFPTGSASLTGGGVFNLANGFVHAGGSFSCLSNILQGGLSGCEAGQGVRWDTFAVLPAVQFKCTGAASETLKTAITSTGDNPDTVVLGADFYRAGDGNDESITGKIIISTRDLDPITPGIQNVWIEKVGCGTANVNFSH